MSPFKRLRFSTDIGAPPARVFEQMLADRSYRDWTSAFAQGSHYLGTWAQGERLRFMSPSGDGMLSQVAEHRPGEVIALRHLGLIHNGSDDTTSNAARAWVGATESYRFVATPTGTRLEVEQDTPPAYEGWLVDTWPRALQRLKALCEG